MIDPSAAWDPDPLAVGDRVRVRLSGECPDRHDMVHQGQEGAVGCIGVEEDVETSIFPLPAGHFYWVDFPRALCWLNRLYCKDSDMELFARVELERLP